MLVRIDSILWQEKRFCHKFSNH